MRKVALSIIAFIILFIGTASASAYFFSNSATEVSNIFNPKRHETITVTKDLPYKITRVEDNTLEYGKTKIANDGANGVKSITYDVEYKGEKEISRTKISEEVSKEPITRVIAIGTKIIWHCYDTTSYDKNAYNDNKCVNSTGETVFVPDSMAMDLDPDYLPSRKGHPYYNSF